MLSKNEIIDILSEWNFWAKKIYTGIERNEYVDRIVEFLKGINKIIAIYGIRRAGKSYILRQTASKMESRNVLYVNFEETRFPARMDKDFLVKIIDAYKDIVKPTGIPLIILDEIQEVDGWERVVRSLHERNAARFIISGSSAKLMAEEFETLLSGRMIKREIFPLSFREFLKFRNVGEREIILNMEKRKHELEEYIKKGGFPEIVLEGNEEKKREIITNYWDSIMIKDIKKRFRIRNEIELETLGRFLVANPTSPISFRKTGSLLNIPFKTIERFFKYFETARLVRGIKRFSWKVMEQERSQRKSYLLDISFFTFSGFKFSENLGKIIENTVAVELLRRFKDVFYWKDYQGKEVDFVLKEGLKVKQLIQVTYASGRDEIEKREIRSLLKASRELGCKNLLVITWDFEREESREGKRIKFVPLWKWLLWNDFYKK